MKLGRTEFLKRLAKECPEAMAMITEYADGQLHCEVAAWRRATEAAIEAGRLWEAERHFRLVEELLPHADDALRNALEVSYLEDFSLGECTAAKYQAVKERMSKPLRDVLIAIRSEWR